MVTRGLKLAFAIAVFSVAVTPNARAASFDCSQAKTRTENVVCDVRALNDQDVRMAMLLEVIAQFELMGGRGAQRDDQRAWLKQRDACDASVACLTRTYQRRVDTLRSQVHRLPGAQD